MKRTLAVVGVAVMTVVGAVAACRRRDASAVRRVHGPESKRF